MTTQRRAWKIALLLALFLAAFIPRALYPVSRPLQWYERSFRFVDAVLHGQWADTVVSYHPGVTPMWLIGLAQHGYYALITALGGAGLAVEGSAAAPPHPLDTAGRAFQTEVSISILPLAAALALGVLACWWLLRELFGEDVAWAGAGLLALDPFHIAISKVVHVDALLSELMLLSALTLLVHLKRSGGDGRAGGKVTANPGGQWFMCASGVLAGLAFLTKSPAYFLVPFLGLSLLTMRRRTNLWRGYLAPALIWVGAAAVTYVALWPAMWVQPLQTLKIVIDGAIKASGQAHPQPLYYLGKLTTEDPGLGYYGVALLVKTTVLSLPLFVVGLLSPLAATWRRGQRRSLVLVIAYFVFFVAQMGLGAKKMPRYLLPAFAALDVIAGVGLATLVRRMMALLPLTGRGRQGDKETRSAEGAPATPGMDGGLLHAWANLHGTPDCAGGLPRWGAAPWVAVFIGVVLAAQAALVWPYHPYYVTHANLLVGGPAGAGWYLLATPEGEGLDLVAQHLNEKPGADQLRVGVQMPAWEAFRQYFVGEVADTRESDLDYLVFADVYVRRRVAEDQWGAQWQEYRYQVPEYTAEIRGEPYAWLYKADDGPQRPAVPLQVCVGEDIRLQGYTLLVDGASLDAQAVHPGDSLRLTLHWEATGASDGDYSVFVHVLGPQGELVTQQDNPPQGGTYPTFLWKPGERVDDPYELAITSDLVPGSYTLAVGMYDWRTGERLAALADCASPLSDNAIVLTTFDVRAGGVAWWQVLAWAVAGVLGVGGVGLCLADVRWAELRRRWKETVAAVSVFFTPAPSPAPVSVGWQDGVLIVAVMALALAVRLPYLMQIPRLGDEVFEALQALRIARGEIRPVVGVNALFGPLFAYLLALCFQLFGASPFVPRALATAAAVVTVGLTYLLARHRLRNRGAAVLAAALMATTPTHILVNGHLGYSNSTTPMFTTAMILALAAGIHRRSGPLLVLGGLLAGLSLQTHLSIVPLLVGLLLWFLAQRQGRAWLRTGWPYLALVAALVAYSPVIWFNLRSGFATLSEPLAHPYAYTGEIDLARYVENLRLLIWELTWMVGGRMSLSSEPVVFLLAGVLRVGWLVAGLVLALRRRDDLLFALLLATMAVMPAFNSLYSRTMGTRYIAWLLPVVYTSMAALLPTILDGWHNRLRGAVVGICVAVLVLFPLAPLGMYYASHQARHRTNQDLLRFAQTIDREADASSLVVISEGTDLLYLSNAGTVLSAMDYLLTLQDTPHLIVPSDQVVDKVEQEGARSLWVVAEWEEGGNRLEALGLKLVDRGIIGGEPEQLLGLFARP